MMNRFIVIFHIHLVLIPGHCLKVVPDTCGLTNADGINSFTLRGSSPVGEIALIHIQFDTERKLAVTSTVLHDELNLVQNLPRSDKFRKIKCKQLSDKQQNCGKTFKLSEPQKFKIWRKSGDYTAWDRGHMTPVDPMRFSADAMNATFYCVNNAPQEPWTNRCAWYAVEERALKSARNFSSFVMTGLCSADNLIDGDTLTGLSVPDCYWKMICYIDPETSKPQVVAFISDNTLIPFEDRSKGRKQRMARTTVPRSQTEVWDLVAERWTQSISNAWLAAEKFLTKNRDSSRALPTAEMCISVETLSSETADLWKIWMRKHRGMGNCRNF